MLELLQLAEGEGSEAGGGLALVGVVVELEGRRHFCGVAPDLHLDYFGLVGVAQFGLVGEEEGVWEHLAELLGVARGDHPALDFPLVLGVLALVDPFAVFDHGLELAGGLVLGHSGLALRLFLSFTGHQLGQLVELGFYGLQFAQLLLQPGLVVLAGLAFLVPEPRQQLYLPVVLLMAAFELRQLSFQDLPLALSDFFSVGNGSFPLGLAARIVLVIVPSEGLFEFHKVSVLLETHFLPPFGLLLGLLELLLQLLELVLELVDGLLDVLVLIDVQFLFLLLLDVLDVLEFLLQLLDGGVLEADPVFELVEPGSRYSYLSTDSVEISLALRSFSTFLYIYICL